MPQIIDEKDSTSPIARLIIPSSSQLIIICKNFIFKEAIIERLSEQSQSRSWSGDHKEEDYQIGRPIETTEQTPPIVVRTLNVVVNGDIKKALQVLINASLISIATYRGVSNAIKECVSYAHEPEPFTPSP